MIPANLLDDWDYEVALRKVTHATALGIAKGRAMDEAIFAALGVAGFGARYAIVRAFEAQATVHTAACLLDWVVAQVQAHPNFTHDKQQWRDHLAALDHAKRIS